MATSGSSSFWRGRRVLLTGQTGFKGAWLALWLHRLGAQVTGFALDPDTEPNLHDLLDLDGRLDSRRGDVRDRAAVEAVTNEVAPHVVLHLAAQALVRRSYVDPIGTWDTNVMGTANVLEALRGVDGVEAVVVVTSDKCYENREWSWPYREVDALGGHDPYSSSKAGAELVTSAWRRSFLADRSVGVASARAGNVIGGGDWSADRLIPDCLGAFARGEPVVIRRPGAVRPWQHVLEPLAGYLTLAEQLVGRPGDLAEAWNFGPSVDDARPVAWIVEQLRARWGDGASWRLESDPQPHEAGLLQVDASKARAALGWRPRLPLAHGLAWTVEWYRRLQSGEDAVATTLGQIARYEQLAPQDEVHQ